MHISASWWPQRVWLQGCVKSGGGTSVMKPLPLWVGVLVCVNGIPDLPRCDFAPCFHTVGGTPSTVPRCPWCRFLSSIPSSTSSPLHPIYLCFFSPFLLSFIMLFLFLALLVHLPCPSTDTCQLSARSKEGDSKFSHKIIIELYGWIYLIWKLEFFIYNILMKNKEYIRTIILTRFPEKAIFTVPETIGN